MCPKENIVPQANKNHCARSPQHLSVFRGLPIDDVDHALVISHKEYALVSQFTTSCTETDDNRKKLQKANIICFPCIGPCTISPVLTKEDVIPARLCSICVKAHGTP